MKTFKQPRNPGICWAMTLLLVGALLLIPLHLSAQAQETNAVAPSTAEATPAVAPQATAPAAETVAKQEQSAGAYSRGVEELLKLAEAKVSKEVMLKFIATSGLVVYPSAAELVAMKRHDVPDEVIVAFMDRGAAMEIETRTSAQRRRVAAPAIVSALSTDGEMDPDSYDFWWYHYGYPRALTYSYQQLTPYLPTYSTYSPTYSYSRRGIQSFPYSSGYSAGRPPVLSSRTQFGTVPAGSASRHASFSVPSSMTFRRQEGR